MYLKTLLIRTTPSKTSDYLVEDIFVFEVIFVGR